MFRICIHRVHFTLFVIHYACDVFFNSLTMFWRDIFYSVFGYKYKMGVKIIVFYFHNEENKVIRLIFLDLFFLLRSKLLNKVLEAKQPRIFFSKIHSNYRNPAVKNQ